MLYFMVPSVNAVAFLFKREKRDET
jgi:hypothetical protein